MPLNPDQFKPSSWSDMLKQSTPNDPTRVPRSMFLQPIFGNARVAHISKEVAQGTIDTNVVDPSHHAITHCGQTWESGEALDTPPSRGKVCKACRTKSGIEI